MTPENMQTSEEQESELYWKNEEDIDEREWLRAAASNPAFDFLKNSEEDIYTLADGTTFS